MDSGAARHVVPETMFPHAKLERKASPKKFQRVQGLQDALPGSQSGRRRRRVAAAPSVSSHDLDTIATLATSCLDLRGHRESTLKSDTDAAMIAFRNRVAAMCRADVTTKDAVKGDKESNGLIVNAVMQLRGVIRTIKCHIESRTERTTQRRLACHTMVGGARRMHLVQVLERSSRKDAI